MAELKRQIAKIVPIKSIKSGTYIEREGWEPNSVQTEFGEVSRINCIGIIIEISKPVNVLEEQSQFVIDDGTETIEVRSFEKLQLSSQIDVGSTVLLIGKPRKYMDNMYIIPEIIKPLQKEWIAYRKKQFAQLEKIPVEELPKSEESQQIEKPETVKKTVVEPEKEESEEESVTEKSEENIIQTIDSLDEGSGVNIEIVISQVTGDEESLKEKINSLLLHGEIFEIKPGFLKVLK